MATGSGDHTIRLWHASAHTCVAVLKHHEAAVNDVAFSPDGLVESHGSVVLHHNRAGACLCRRGGMAWLWYGRSRHSPPSACCLVRCVHSDMALEMMMQCRAQGVGAQCRIRARRRADQRLRLCAARPRHRHRHASIQHLIHTPHDLSGAITRSLPAGTERTSRYLHAALAVQEQGSCIASHCIIVA